MSFARRREVLFVYSVKDANPNGDPLNANHPRYDAETGQVLVSDVRIKRTIRDQWVREGLPVFVDGEAKTLKKRIEELKSSLNVNTGREALEKCLDTRVFGVTFALDKEAFSWTGPVQFKWGRSLHKCKPEMIQGTAAFATKEDSEQRSFRNEYIVPFVLLGVYGVANQYPSKETGAMEEDIDQVSKALWQGTVNLITRSKVGHAPRLLLEVIYKEGFSGIAGALDENLRLLAPDGKALTEDEQLTIRTTKECVLDITGIVARLEKLVDKIEIVKLTSDDELLVQGMEELRNLFGDRLFEQR